MSSGNVELVQRMLGAYLTGDEQTLRDMIPPDGEIYGDRGLINAGTYRGYEGFRQWIRHWEEAWEEVDYELLETTEIGDALLVIPVHITGRGAGSGVEIDSVLGWLFEFSGGKVLRFHAYVHLDDALAAARRLAGSG